MVSMAVGVGHVPMMQVVLCMGLIIGFFRGGFVSSTSEKLGFLNMLGASEPTEVIHSVFWWMCVTGLALDRHTDTGEWLLSLVLETTRYCVSTWIQQCI